VHRYGCLGRGSRGIQEGGEVDRCVPVGRDFWPAGCSCLPNAR